MKAKRSKQYRKLMKQYGRIFNFREPYQVLVDAEIVKDASRFKMDLVPALERTLHGKVKPMITQCSMRHLYSEGSKPGMQEVIGYAKENLERRRCGHHPDETEAKPELECLSSFVVDTGKGARNRYVVASQDDQVRRHMRGVKGVPLIYISRSVMIMEPMAAASAEVVSREERAKFRGGITSTAASTAKAGKRKRGDDDDDEEEEDGDGEDRGDESGGDSGSEGRASVSEPEKKKRKKSYGPKGPNPLAAKKKKKKGKEKENPGAGEPQKQKQKQKLGDNPNAEAEGSSEQPTKRKRRRRTKKLEGDSGGAKTEGEGGSAVAATVTTESAEA